jgi:hypothetical protein
MMSRPPAAPSRAEAGVAREEVARQTRVAYPYRISAS